MTVEAEARIEAEGDLRAEIERWISLDAQIKEMERERKDIAAWIVERVDRQATWIRGAEQCSLTVIRARTPVLDLDLVKETSPQAYEAVRKDAVDREALGQMIELGLFEPGAPLAPALTYKVSAPSLRFTTFLPRAEENQAEADA